MRIVERFDIMAVSTEFMALLQDMQELGSAAKVKIGGKVINGPKQLMRCKSMAEVEAALPEISKAHPKMHIRIVRKYGECFECRDPKPEELNIPFADCPHIDNMGQVTLHCTAWNVKPSA